MEKKMKEGTKVNIKNDKGTLHITQTLKRLWDIINNFITKIQNIKVDRHLLLVKRPEFVFSP